VETGDGGQTGNIRKALDWLLLLRRREKGDRQTDLTFQPEILAPLLRRAAIPIGSLRTKTAMSKIPAIFNESALAIALQRHPPQSRAWHAVPLPLLIRTDLCALFVLCWLDEFTSWPILANSSEERFPAL